MRIRYLWPGIAWIVVILILTGTPGQYIPKVSSYLDLLQPDKLVHAFMFGVLFILLAYGWEKQATPRYHKVTSRILIFLASAIYGGGIELLQDRVFINRTGSWWDFIADCIGIGLGVFVYSKWFKRPTFLRRILDKIT